MNMITNLLWCPIALPKFPVDNFLREVEPLVVSQIKSKKMAERRWAKCWNTAEISHEFLQTLREKYVELDSWFNLLPCTSILKLKLNVQIGPVVAHVDIEPTKWLEEETFSKWVSQEPTGYRVLISGGRTNTLFTVLNDKKIYPVIPEDTNTYVFHSSSLSHGVEDDPGRKLVYMNLEIDESKHQKLLEDSLNKYRDYAIFGP